MSPLRGSLMVANVFYKDTTPTGFYGAGTYIFYIDATPTGFYGGGTYIATQMTPLRGLLVVLSDFLHRCHTYAVLWRGYLHFLHRCRPYGA